MPGTRSFPFRRLACDSMIRGSSRIWWHLEPHFYEPEPHSYQLQVGYSGVPTAVDWTNVGTPAENAFHLVDDEIRDVGKVLTKHYRVILTTPVGTYVSPAVHCQGELDEKSWLEAGEIVRKELLRHKLVSRSGFLLKRHRFGKKCRSCRDALSDEPTNSECLTCYGTGFEVGYCAPVPFQCFDLSPQIIQESQDAQARGTVRDNATVKARVIGFPMLARYDVWVDPKSDERWVIDSIQHVALIRGVPLISDVAMNLAPLSHVVYRVEVGGEPADREGPVLPGAGTGEVTIDHDYGGADNLIYATASGHVIPGATILAFLTSDYEAAGGTPDASQAIASSSTMANGRWSYALQLDPGNYTLVFEKLGEFGPDSLVLVVVPEGSSASLPETVSVATGADFWAC